MSSWNSLGQLAPQTNMWLPFQSTNSSTELFRVSFSGVKPDQSSYAFLYCRFLGGALDIPPSHTFRVYPSSDLQLISNLLNTRFTDLQFPQELIDAGYNKRIFYVKRSAGDKFINWSLQIEELVL